MVIQYNSDLFWNHSMVIHDTECPYWDTAALNTSTPLLPLYISFFRNPLADYNIPMRSLLSWFTDDTVISKRQELGMLIMELQRELNPDLDYDPTQDGCLLGLKDDDDEEDDSQGDLWRNPVRPPVPSETGTKMCPRIWSFIFLMLTRKYHWRNLGFWPIMCNRVMKK